MGKSAPSMRSSTVSVTALINPSSNLPSQHQSLARKPNYLAKRSPKEKPSKIPSEIGAESSLPSVNFNSSSLPEAKSLFNQLISAPKKIPSGHMKSSRFDLYFCNSILQNFASIATLQDSILFLNHMIKAHPPFSPDSSTYNVLLVQACKNPDYSLSFVHQVLNFMTDRGFPPNNMSMDIAVRALCCSGREDDAIELVKELAAKNLLPDSYTYNFLVGQLVKHRELSTVNGFIKEMREDFDVKPDLITYTIMINNVCNKKNLREATHLLGVLSEEGYKPDCYVYNTVMKGFCMLTQSGEVLEVYKKMLAAGVKPDLVTYNTLIYGLSKSGRVKEAKKFLVVMVEMGHFPDAVTYTSLMNGMCREGDALGALALLGDMEAKSCSPNTCTYNTLLHGLCKSRFLDKGIELYKVMKEGNMMIESGTYGAFLRALCRNGRVAEAYEVFDYAIDSKSMTDVAAYSTLENTLKWLKKA